jgi:hypothetical protein
MGGVQLFEYVDPLSPYAAFPNFHPKLPLNRDISRLSAKFPFLAKSLKSTHFLFLKLTKATVA